MNWYEQSIEDAVKLTNGHESLGIGDDERERRLEAHGFNQLKEARQPSALLVFLQQFKDFMVLVLIGATVLSGLLGEYLDAIAILLIIVMNGVLGFIQERKAEKSLAALKELAAPTVTALREGEWVAMPAKRLVIGDIVSLSSGDRVGADVRLLEAKGLYVEESALTGESLPVKKTGERLAGTDLPLGDQENMAFMGTMVTKGSGKGLVVNTGMATEMGKIADLIQSAEPLATPLQMKLEQLGKILIVLALLLTAFVVALGVIQGNELYHMILSGVSLAVAAIPEGLPAIVTIALALGVQKMIRRKAIVRKLPSVETLGCATVICSDKTGTLTQNRMTVTHLWTDGQMYTLPVKKKKAEEHFFRDGQPIAAAENSNVHKLLAFAVLCNHASLVKSKAGEEHFEGDPTEGALLISGKKAGLTKDKLLRDYRIIEEFPFDSTRKMMSVIVQDKRGRKYVVTKGAPDVLLERCQTVEWHGKRQIKHYEHIQQVNAAIAELGGQALRTLAVAYKPIKTSDAIGTAEQAENRLTFVGIQGMIDPPRPEVKSSIKECQKAGIKTVMITGDHALTASAIAKQLNILPNGGKVLEGSALNAMSENELIGDVDNIYVYARVSPEDKLKIVKALQAKGHIVAMTGDGVNDAPAIKTANIGIAMGQTGTDVAKEASSLILSDDNFATIRAAIEEGRNIYENIRKFIRYLLASNVGEILVMLFAMILALPLPLLPIQILWVNLVTDGLPAMALGVDSAEDDMMTRPPRKPDEGVFSRGLGWKVISRGFLIGLVTIISFIAGRHADPAHLDHAQTIAFATLVMAQLIHVFDCRSSHSILHRNPLENKWLVFAVLSSVLLVLIVIYLPVLQPVFHTVPLSIRDWLLVIGLSALPTFSLSGFHLSKRKRGGREAHLYL